MALARERVDFHGETLELPLPDGPGKPLKLTITPVQQRIPIYLAAIGPKNTALAGEIADGWIPTLLDPEHLSALRESLDEGAARAGRSLNGSFDIAPSWPRPLEGAPPPRRVRRPGPRLPHARARPCPGGARARRHAADVAALARGGRGGGDALRGGARVPRLPHARPAAEAVSGGRA